MRALIWLVRLFLFLVLFGFALKNDEVVVLNFFFGSQWQVPLVLVILLFVVIGVLIGVTATLATVYRQHREISSLRGKVDSGSFPVERRGAPPVVSGPDLPESY
ncbi:lipopolysaccharide assembly protein LapA domain-containing protein [Zoogloea sp.]|uniref:lipopolysaccharide assembly protein LapA domain-containing protein n=1 Tax=Zoogloea sp. TaxID=49181 RepID=UPI0035B2D442